MDAVIADAVKQLYGLLEKYTKITEDGFAIDIETDFRQWDRCAKTIGIHPCYKRMSRWLAEKYAQIYSKPYLFTEECMAYEIEYHFDAFMWSMGLKGYTRNVTTLIFSKAQLISHCRIINISTTDAHDIRQKTMFAYRKGVRQCYRGTSEDPYADID